MIVKGMWWVGMQRVQITWYRMKKGDDVNIAMKTPQFGELMTSHATLNFHRVTSDSISVGNHQICSLLIVLKRFEIVYCGRSRFSVICCGKLKDDRRNTD